MCMAIILCIFSSVQYRTRQIKDLIKEVNDFVQISKTQSSEEGRPVSLCFHSVFKLKVMATGKSFSLA